MSCHDWLLRSRAPPSGVPAAEPLTECCESTMRPASLLIAVALIAIVNPRVDTRQTSPAARRMSFHNRLLLNRLVVSGRKSTRVLVLARGEARAQGFALGTGEIASLAGRLRGRVLRTEEGIGYLRIEVPTGRLLELAASPAIEAYQIASLSKASWYRDGPPLLNATMFRGFENTPIAAGEPGNRHADLPLLSIEASREPGYTADDDVGIGEWMAQHPTFDGRGVTIAVVEGAGPSFADPTLRAAKTLDGDEVAKIAGIVNVIDPENPDNTRVTLDTEVRADTSWARIGSRTYILPRPGAYRFGLLLLPAGANVVHQFGVVEDEHTREVWIDANGDASFQDESPLADINQRVEPRFLKLTHPRQVDVSFVMGRGSGPHVVHIYVTRASHEAMTLGTAAGSQTNESLAYGVAPSARVLLVRNSTSEYQLGDVFEGFIEAAKRPEVDIVSSSGGITLVPDTAADFGGVLFERLVRVYGKPIVNGALNNHLQLGTSLALGAVLSVGGSLGPKTYASLHGGRPLERMIVHPTSSAGPSLDGAIKPDFIAPVERLSTDLPWNRDLEAVPDNAPLYRLPRGYQISCCTSASGPYAAGVIALLISGAKQMKMSYSVESLTHAMKISARFLSGFGSHEQGNGVLDVKAAWRELTHPVDVPRIVASAEIVHPLAQYAARGPRGEGILEFEGWTPGMTGIREIRLRRESGPDRPITYVVSWTGNDGTFHTSRSVTLPLRKTIALPVTIAAKSAGAHSALLNLHDHGSNVISFRTQATIVAAEHIDPTNGSVRITGRVPFLRTHADYIQVPPGAAAISFELEVLRGVIRPSILPAHGLFPGYYLHVHPRNITSVATGTHTVILPNPGPGTWTIQTSNNSKRFHVPGDPPADDEDAEYALTVRVLSASIHLVPSPPSVAVDVTNLGSAIREPVITVSPGTLKTHRATFRPDGLPNAIDISVPKDAATLSLRLRNENPGVGVELYLYDCTSGECFSYNIGFPARPEHTMVVRRPNPGRWVAAVNPAPFPTADGSFVLDEIVTTGPSLRHASAGQKGPGVRWTETIDIDGVTPSNSPGAGTPILFFELLDAAAERDEATYPWDPGPNAIKLRDRPVALATAIYCR
jgi:hypothetical protein